AKGLAQDRSVADNRFNRADSRRVALLKRGHNRGERGLLTKRDPHPRADTDAFRQCLGNSVIKLAMNRAVDNDADEGWFHHRFRLVIVLVLLLIIEFNLMEFSRSRA